MSYIIQRMPWKVCYRISIVFALSCGRTKRNRVSYIWTRIFRRKAKKNLRFQKYPDTCADPAVKSPLFDRGTLLCSGVCKFSREEAPPPRPSKLQILNITYTSAKQKGTLFIHRIWYTFLLPTEVLVHHRATLPWLFSISPNLLKCLLVRNLKGAMSRN